MDNADLFDKASAAKYLSTKELTISVRKLELLATDGRIGRVYVPGARGRQVRFKKEELDRLKLELAGEAIVEQPATSLVRQNSAQPNAQGFANNELSLALLATADRMRTAPAHQSVNITDKLMLSLDDAAELSSLPRAFLKKQIDENRLKAIRTGRGYRIKRADLDTFVHEL